MVTKRGPQPRGVGQQVHPRAPVERLIAGGVDITNDGVGDVGVDVKGGGAGRPVGRARLAGDRSPREQRALQAVLSGPLDGHRKRVVPPAQRIGGRVRGRQGQHRQHEGLGIPERVPVVAGPGQPLGGDRLGLRARTGLQHVEQREAHRLLHLGVPVYLDVGTIPEVVKVRALLGEQPVPAAVPGCAECRPRLITYGRQRPLARRAKGDELDHAQLLPRLQHRGHGDQATVGEHPGLDQHPGRAVDQVIHGRGHVLPAELRRVREHDNRSVGVQIVASERTVERGGCAGVRAGRRRQLLVRHQLGLHREPRRNGERFHLIADRSDGPLGERHQPGRGEADPFSGRRHPLGTAVQHPGAKVEQALVGTQVASTDIERLVIDKQAD